MEEKSTQQREMEESHENSKELSHSAHANEWMNEWMNEWTVKSFWESETDVLQVRYREES